MGRTTFLRRVSVQRCLELIDAHVAPRRSHATQQIPVCEALDRVTSRLVRALQSNPSAHVAAMDGVAVRSADLAQASEDRPQQIVLGAQAQLVDTGDALPPGFDAVVMAEDLQFDDPEASAGSRVEVAAVVAPFKHVRLAGEDVVQGEVLLPRGRRVGPAEIGALLGGGVTVIDVATAPLVTIIPTGDELVSPGQAVPPGGVPEFNSEIVAAMVRSWGGAPKIAGRVPDDEQRLAIALQGALDEADVVVLLAGSSAGRHDFTPSLIAAVGELLVHGVNVMPGKPFALGMAQGKPVLGLPGYPVSAHVAAERFLKPIVERLLGCVLPERPKITARLSRKVASKVGHEEVLRVALGRVGEGAPTQGASDSPPLLASPLRRGAGVITSLCQAHGLVRIAAGTEGKEAGDPVTVELLRPLAEIDATCVLAGSHDLALSWLDDLMREAPPFAGLAAQALGSLGGLIALARGAAHVAGIHLLHPATGQYNLPYVREYLGQQKVKLVTLAHREQGLMVLPGNPRSIVRVDDLLRPATNASGRLRLANRQRGSGTRVLLDHLLDQAGCPSAERHDTVEGYDHEEITHMAAAMAVKTGLADVALGIRAVPDELGLEFVHVTWERFDLVIPHENLELVPVRRLLTTLRSDAFATALGTLPGYDPRQTGHEVEIGGPPLSE